LASKPCQTGHDERSSDCRMRLKSISLEFPTSSSSFHIRNKENLIAEWGRVSFNRAFHADQAFEIVVKWFMSTGQTVADLVQKQWMRYAQKSGLHMFPVPEDAFAEPTNRMSSPLRCPIFVDLKVECIPEEKFYELLHRIMVLFGFILFKCPLHKDRNERREEKNCDDASLVPQYVHLSGGMSVKYAPTQRSFMWSWNPLLSSRYRSGPSTEEFLDFMLNEFRSFCNNDRDRLTTFVQESTSRSNIGEEDMPCESSQPSATDAIFGSPEFSLFQSNDILSSI